MSNMKNYTIDDIIKKAKENNSNCDTQLILKAYQLAKSQHGDQCRKSGEPYIIHPLQVAYTMASLDMDAETISAALLHDVVEDTPVTIEEIRKMFGESVENMVAGFTKLNKLKYTT